MKGFTKFIIKNHPDPDGLIDIDIDNEFNVKSDIAKVDSIDVKGDYIYLLIDESGSEKLEVNDKVSFINENQIIKTVFKIIKKDNKYIVLNNNSELIFNKDQLYIINLKIQTQLLIE